MRGILGPNRCGSCGGEYGHHSENCIIRKNRERESKRVSDINEMFDWFQKNKAVLDSIIAERMSEEHYSYSIIASKPTKEEADALKHLTDEEAAVELGKVILQEEMGKDAVVG